MTEYNFKREKRAETKNTVNLPVKNYTHLLSGVSTLLEQARTASVRSVNAIMTATYWEIGRRIVEYDQKGNKRAEYGALLLKKLSRDLTRKLGRGFGVDHLELFRSFYLHFPDHQIINRVSQKSESVIRKSGSTKSESVIRKFNLTELAEAFPLSWTHYVHLVRRSRSPEARAFYEQEALRGGWSVRQLDRQISSQFYERTALSKNKVALLTKGSKKQKSDIVTPEEQIKDPFVLEFLNLKDEYSENDLEEALIKHLEHFLMELGGDFTFVGRQKRLRIGNQWYRIDLLFFHRRLKCLVIIDLKIGAFTHADAGQMHLYLNYAKEHWTNADENPPVGLILCAEKDSSVAKYALEGLPNKVMAAEYQTRLPNEKKLAREIQQTRKQIESRMRK